MIIFAAVIGFGLNDFTISIVIVVIRHVVGNFVGLQHPAQ